MAGLHNNRSTSLLPGRCRSGTEQTIWAADCTAQTFLGQFADTDGGTLPKVNHFPFNTRGFARLHKGLYGVVNKCHIRAGAQVSELDLFAALQPWVITVGITSRLDCRGPYVLNGRNTTTGRSKLQK